MILQTTVDVAPRMLEWVKWLAYCPLNIGVNAFFKIFFKPRGGPVNLIKANLSTVTERKSPSHA